MSEKTGTLSAYKIYNTLSNPKEQSNNLSRGMSILSSAGIGLCIISFFISRASILHGLTPFGLPFFTAVMNKYKRFSLVGLFSLIGIVTVQGLEYSQRYMFAILLYYIASTYILKKEQKSNIYIHGALISASLLGTSLIKIALTKFYLYDVILVSLEVVIVFVACLIFNYGINVVMEIGNRKLLSTEELLSLIIVLSLMVMGLGNIKLLNNSILNIFGILIIMIFAYNWGAAFGCASGVIIGVITSLSNQGSPEIVGLYGFAGLLAGAFKDMGKHSSGIGFLLGAGILSLYTKRSFAGFIGMQEVLIATLILVVLPNKVINYITKFKGISHGAIQHTKYSERLKELTINRLKEFSRVFDQLSSSFSQISEEGILTNTGDVSELIDSVAKKVCNNCGVSKNCWEKNFYSSYQRMFDVITIAEAKVKIGPQDLPAFFKDNCIKTNDLCKWVNYYLELYKINMRWNKKVDESRNLVSQQLRGVSKVIGELASEITIDTNFNSDIEQAVMVELDKSGIRVDEVIAIETANKGIELNICKKNCGGKGECNRLIAPIVSKALDKYFIKTNKYCNTQGKENCCSFKLVQPLNYSLTTGVARFSPEGEVVSGDNYTFMELKDGKYVIALSDGMGRGTKANRESSTAISLMEQFFEAGFNKDITIKTINSMLVLKSSEEAFTTMDIAIIDQYRGDGEFIKIGAAPTFIKRDNGVEQISSATLPIGILEDVEMKVTNTKLVEGDFVIMISDGIIESCGQDNEDWLEQLIEDINTKNPQEMADLIFNEALARSGNTVKDDMTVVVSKVRRSKDRN